MNKQLPVIICFIHFLQIGYTQPKLINLNLKNKDTNLIFAGYANTFQIENIKQGKDFMLTAANATILKYPNTNIFTVKTSRIGYDTLTILKNKTVLLKKVFQVIKNPEIKITIGSIKDSSATVNEILSQRGLCVTLNHYEGIERWFVMGFRIHFISKKINIEQNRINIFGNFLTKEALEIIKKLHPNDRIIFEDIRIHGASSWTRGANSFTIRIR